MNLITWNVQWCRGCDGRVDPARIVSVARAMADFDVLCLQELADNYPGLAGSSGEDQFAMIAALLPGYTAVAGVATDRRAPDGRRRRFGNAIFSRLPVTAAFRHLLPWPADPKVASMQRVAVEVVLDTGHGPLRVTTTHLEYYSAKQRAAQVERLRELHAEAGGHATEGRGPAREGGPFEAFVRPASAILTADFNFRPCDPEYARLLAPLGEGVPAYRDAWAVAHPGCPHPATVGVHDRAQWPQPGTFDLFLVTEDLAPRVAEVRVDLDTDASDHQPVLLRLR